MQGTTFEFIMANFQPKEIGAKSLSLACDVDEKVAA